MENKINNYSDLPEKIEFDSEFMEIFNLMEYSKQNIFITGKAGTGKTTLLETIIGHHRPYLGHINYKGVNISKLLPYERAKLGLAYVPQGREIFPRLTVKENLFTGLSIKNNKYKIDSEVLSLFPILNEMQDRFGGDLSGGQQQQLAIARALLMRPKVLILDEPTSALDRTIQLQILKLLTKLQNKYNMAYLFISHNLRLMKFFADRLLVMNQGSIVEEGLTSEIFKKPKSKYSKLLFEAAFNKNYY